MKIKVKTDYDGCEYITAGKIYEANVLVERDISCSHDGEYLFSMINDRGNKILCRELGSSHLNGHYFEVIEE